MIKKLAGLILIGMLTPFIAFGASYKCVHELEYNEFNQEEQKILDELEDKNEETNELEKEWEENKVEYWKKTDVDDIYHRLLDAKDEWKKQIDQLRNGEITMTKIVLSLSGEGEFDVSKTDNLPTPLTSFVENDENGIKWGDSWFEENEPIWEAKYEDWRRNEPEYPEDSINNIVDEKRELQDELDSICIKATSTEPVVTKSITSKTTKSVDIAKGDDSSISEDELRATLEKTLQELINQLIALLTKQLQEAR